MSVWRLAYRSLLREWRAGALRIVAYALLVATAGLVSVASFGDRLGQTLASQGGELLGADLVVHVQAPPREEWIRRAGDLGLSRALTVSFRSVVSAGEQSLLAEVKAVQTGYPLRGTLRIADAPELPGRPAGGVPQPGSVWMDSQLRSQLQLDMGGEVSLGERRFPVNALVTLEPDRGGIAFTLAPRLMLNIEDLEATGLVQPGSLVHYHWLLAGPADRLQSFKQWLLEQGVAKGAIREADDAQPRFAIALDRGERFLLLATLVSVLLAGIAVATSMRHYARQQWDSVAIMRCFGARQRDIASIYLLKLLLLALIASLIGVALGLLGQQLLGKILSGLVAGNLPLPTLKPVILGLATGLVTVLGFALPPLLQLRNVAPLRVIRRDLDLMPVRGYLVYGTAFLAVAGLVAWIAKDVPLTLWVVGVTVVTLLLLIAAAYLLVNLLGRLRPTVSASWRFGIATLARRARSSIGQIVTIGIGVMAMLLLTTVRSDLWQEWQVSLPEETPNHFLINIQPDQLADVRTFFAEQGMPQSLPTPIVRARLVSINDSAVDPENFAGDFAQRQLQRAANLSWAEQPQADNKVVEGRWWSAEEWAKPLLSIEREYAAALNLKLGDELTYRIADQELKVRVASFRSVDWDSFRPNFFLLVPPELLRGFPASYITSLYLPREQYEKIDQLIKRFPNITDIDVNALLEQVRRVLDKVNAALQFIFLFTLAAGIAVLWAALDTNRLTRRKEIAVLRALGARARDIRLGLVTEFVLLGVLAGAVGAAAAAGFGYVLSHFLFDLPYRVNLQLWVAGVPLAVILVVCASLFSVRDDLKTPPWQALRESE